MPTEPIPDTIPENELAEKLGLHRNVLRAARFDHLKPDTDWVQKKSAVHLTASGVRALCGHLDCPVPPRWAEKAPEKKDAAEAWENEGGALAESEQLPSTNQERPGLKNYDRTHCSAGEQRIPGTDGDSGHGTVTAAVDAPVLADGIVTVFVTRRAAKNPHIIFAREKKGGVMEGQEYAIRVRDSFAYVPGDELRVKTEKTLAWLFGPQPKQRRRPMARTQPTAR